jgi:antitoxin CptB
MDLILGRFADAQVESLSEADLDRFEALLEVADHDLYQWIIGTTQAPAEFDHALLANLRASAPASNG